VVALGRWLYESRYWLLWLGACLMIGVFARWWWFSSNPTVVQGRLVEGIEIQVVMIASASCPVCTSQEFREEATAALHHLSTRSWPQGTHLASVFIGLGVDPGALVELAGHYGTFDELIVGHGWANVGAMRYIWRDMPAEGATPQIVVTQRELKNNEHTRGIAPPEEILLLRLIGLHAITRWARLGYPIPGVGESGDEG